MPQGRASLLIFSGTLRPRACLTGVEPFVRASLQLGTRRTQPRSFSCPPASGSEISRELGRGQEMGGFF